MPLLQPSNLWDKIHSGVKLNTNAGETLEFTPKLNVDELKGTVLSYPKEVGNRGLSNMMAIYFNSLESAFNISESNAPNINYENMTGWSGNMVNVPYKNRAFQSLLQEKTLDSVLGKLPVPAEWSEKIKEGRKNRKYKRSENMIWMMLPNTLNFSTNAAWSELNFDPNALGLLSIVGASGDDNGLSFFSQEQREKIKSIVEREAAEAVLNLTGSGNLGAAITKSIQNTYNDMNFGAMSRRNFVFEWNLAPKSPNELIEIDNIIRLMRFHAHPSFSDVGGEHLGAYLTYPGQVDVEWYVRIGDLNNDYEENAWIPKISSCVITAVETNLTPNNHYSFFHNTGAPTHIQLRLALTEIVPLVKTDIARGF